MRLTFIFDPTVLLSLVHNDIKKRQFLHREQEYGNPGSVILYITYLIDIYTIFNTVF